MNDNEVMELGGFCETLLSSPDFQFLAARFEQELVNDILTNQPDDQSQRDRISRVQGFREFLAFVGRTVQRQTEIMSDANPQDQQDLDDPAVHNIFDFE